MRAYFRTQTPADAHARLPTRSYPCSARPHAHSRAHAYSRHCSRALRPCTPDVRLHACMHVHARPRLERSSTSLAPARVHPRSRLRAPVCSSPPARTPASPPALPLARLRPPAHTQVHAPARPNVLPVHPNILLRIPPSHSTLKPLPDSFLVSRG
ncbi:hypothetical protein CRG98_029691 [Punica granatum]|uniref:Uncharacterized protein n=1 Tax=Punica granatum TaxID=22663 RepID=A0A2I0J0Y6_PUNGR|nr:hypothetical protein CRG98_029691 [Punica granatum]